MLTMQNSWLTLVVGFASANIVIAKPLWPENAPPGDWSDTRIGGVTFVSLLVVVWIIGMLVSKRRVQVAITRSRALLENSDGVDVFVFPYYRFKCWLVGADAVQLDNKNNCVTVVSLQAVSNCCCIPQCEYAPEASGTAGSAELSNRKLTALDVGGVIIAGVVGGLWIHLIPCFWWSCDWGEYDGAALRGGIWFISGFVISIVLCCVRCTQRCVALNLGGKRIEIAIDHNVLEPAELVAKINTLLQ